MKPGHRKWSKPETARLYAMFTDGISLEVMCGNFDRSSASIRRKLSDNGMIFSASTRLPVPAIAPVQYASRTAMMMGDPPVGRSALDQRSGAA